MAGMTFIRTPTRQVVFFAERHFYVWFGRRSDLGIPQVWVLLLGYVSGGGLAFVWSISTNQKILEFFAVHRPFFLSWISLPDIPSILELCRILLLFSFSPRVGRGPFFHRIPLPHCMCCVWGFQRFPRPRGRGIFSPFLQKRGKLWKPFLEHFLSGVFVCCLLEEGGSTSHSCRDGDVCLSISWHKVSKS